MMMNLKRNGMLRNLKGLIVGGMSDMNDNFIAFGKTAEQIILEYTKDSDFPICFGFTAGHLADNRCLRLGVHSVLEISKNGVSLSQE